eukprot:364282-Chlamydomonas_euryale.AAC.47
MVRGFMQFPIICTHCIIVEGLRLEAHNCLIVLSSTRYIDSSRVKPASFSPLLPPETFVGSTCQPAYPTASPGLTMCGCMARLCRCASHFHTATPTAMLPSCRCNVLGHARCLSRSGQPCVMQHAMRPEPSDDEDRFGRVQGCGIDPVGACWNGLRHSASSSPAFERTPCSPTAAKWQIDNAAQCMLYCLHAIQPPFCISTCKGPIKYP